MSRVGIFLADGFEEIEGLTVVDILRRAGIDISMISINGKKKVTGAHGIALDTDEDIVQCDPDKLDMLVLPGGMPGTTNLAACEKLTEALKKADQEKRGIAAICAAPSVLGDLGLLIFSSILNIFMDLWMVAGLDLGVFGAALATLIAQGISAVFSLLIFLSRMRRYKSYFDWFDRQELHSMFQIAVPSVLQQSTVSIGMMIVQAVVNPFGTQALAGYAATMRVENVFSLIFVSIGNAVSPYVSQNLGANKPQRIKKGYRAALVLDVCFAAIAFIVIETLHTQISSLFLGKDGTDLAYQVSGDYMRWLGYFFIFMGIKMATDGVIRGLGIMRPFLIANMVNLAIRLSVALIFAPRFGIAFVWLAVPAGWFANFLISYVALRRSWPTEE